MKKLLVIVVLGGAIFLGVNLPGINQSSPWGEAKIIDVEENPESETGWFCTLFLKIFKGDKPPLDYDFCMKTGGGARHFYKYDVPIRPDLNDLNEFTGASATALGLIGLIGLIFFLRRRLATA